MRGIKRMPKKKEMTMGFMGDLGLMGVVGRMGVVLVVSLVVLSVAVWVVWWEWSAVRSREVDFSRSRVVVMRVVSPSLLVWMVIVVISLIVS